MFKNKLKIKYIETINKVRWYELKEPLTATIDEVDYIVPSGFKTDLASIPYPINKIIKTNNPKYAKSSILHDFLYSIKYNRFDSDELFFQAMRSEGTPLRYSILFYLSVRFFGKKYYDKS